MGSYNVLCAVSRHVVECGDKVKLIPVSNNMCISRNLTTLDTERNLTRNYFK